MRTINQVIEEVKRCKLCGFVFPHSQFPKRWIENGYTLFNHCKKCDAMKARKYQIKNSEKVKQADAIYYRKNRKKKLAKSKELVKLKDRKYIARYMVKTAIDSGKIIRPPCEKCGNPKSDAHHPDYSKPFRVIWLCRRHHMLIHSKYENPRRDK